MTEPDEQPLSNDVPEDAAVTAGEEDHSDPDVFRGDEADPPVEHLDTELVDTGDEDGEQQ